MRVRSAEALEVGDSDHVSRVEERRDQADRAEQVGEADGAQSSEIPVVPWPMETIGQPPSGGVPGGVNTVPDT